MCGTSEATRILEFRFQGVYVALAQLPAQGRSFLRPLVLLPPARTGKFTEHTFCGGCLAQVEVKAGGMYTFPRGMSCTWEVR